MKRVYSFFAAVVYSLTIVSLTAQPFLPRQEQWFLPIGESVFRYGFGGWQNPAVIAIHPGFELLGSLSYESGDSRFRQWGLSIITANTSFTKIQTRYDSVLISDYAVSSAVGNQTLAAGLSYRWSSGSATLRSPYKAVTAGLLLRPIPELSTGIAYTQALNANTGSGNIEIAIRPFADPTLALFSNYTLNTNQRLRDGYWQIGLITEPLDGFRFFGSWNTHQQFQVGIQLSITNGLGIQTTITTDQQFRHQVSTAGFRLGGYDRNLRSWLFPPAYVYTLDIPKTIAYQTPQLLSKATPWRPFLTRIEKAAADPTIRAIALNLSTLQLNHAMAWELRQALQHFRDRNKKVFVYITNASFPHLLVAAVADVVAMDPYGFIGIPGYVAGHTYYKELLDSLGLRIEEFRLFKYKSALEPLARSSMSEGEKEQLRTLIQDWYRTTLETLAKDSHLSQRQVDSLIDNVAFFNAQQAYEIGLVDTIARYDVLDSLAQQQFPEATKISHYNSTLVELQNRDKRWQNPAKIAVIYAIGICAMDEGIKARSLVKDVEAAVSDESVKAIVLRVDSPGGDPLASDYIATALKKAKGKKPVIISQGYVAASGGYWLSMYGDTIISTPYTITGSIGVIGGWMYDVGLSKKLHLHLDFVQQGKHGDLGFGYTLPLPIIGNITIPHRPLSADEKQRAFKEIRQLYQRFLDNVADGRDTTADYIHTIAQGRVWSGVRAQQIGLVDVLGSLTDAIRVAKKRAGLSDDIPVQIVEYPQPPLFDIASFAPTPRLTQTSLGFADYLRFRLQHQGKPLLLLPLEYLDSVMLELLRYHP